MARPALPVVDPDSSRRRELSRGLSAFRYEVLRALARARVPGRVELSGADGSERGERAAGEVARAAAGPVRGAKAFLRLARREAGPFRVVPAGPGLRSGAAREIESGLTSRLI